MILSLIVAADERNVIGKANTLPWRLSDDLKNFRAVTQGKVVIMGRKTYDSIGRPLPKRRNMVISRQADLKIEGCEVFPSLDAALAAVTPADPEEVFVIGGGQLYAEALPKTDRLYFTRVHTSVDGGEASFPQVDFSLWHEVSREEHPANTENEFPSTFYVYERKK